MRFTLVVAVALLLTPVALPAGPAASGLQTHTLTDMSAAKKKKPAKKPKEEYLKAAPGTGPSGPKK